MNKVDLVKAVSKKTDYDTETVNTIVTEFMETIKENLLFGVDIKIKDFMTFKLLVRQPTERMNPKTRETFMTNKHYALKPSMSRTFLEKLKQKTVY